MPNDNKSIIYWKWEDATLDTDICEKIDDLCSRTEIHAVFIALHWIKKPLSNEKLLSAIRLCCEELHKRGRKLYLEICPRNEGAAFFERYPDQVAYLTTATEIMLDHSGKGTAEIEVAEIPHYWRLVSHTQEKLINAFCFEKGKGASFKKSTVYNIASKVEICRTVSSGSNKNLAAITVCAGSEHAGKTAVVFIGIPQPIPELASNEFEDFFAEMLEHFSDIPVDGVCSDEWGYDVLIQLENNNTFPNNQHIKPKMYFEHLTYSDNFGRRYRVNSGGSELMEDLLYFYYTEEDDVHKSMAKVNAYNKTFRSIMQQNDQVMYTLAKKCFGENTFFGVHPTWWGNNYLQNFEGFKNGFYWWEAMRDIAQTDEIVIMPIRTALAHKCRSPIWYNMWYSMGTRDIKTYYRETWNNVRYGGRTHYLAYECPNESVVLELKPQGLLECIEEMDAIVRSIDPYQICQPDCRVLVLFGMENCVNWYCNDTATPPWYSRHKVLSAVLECTDKIFQSYLCDLVPTSEIVNGSLTVENGKPRYGTQIYDAVVLLAPDSMEACCYPFIAMLDKNRLIVAGDYAIYSDGMSVSAEDTKLLKNGRWLSDIGAAEEIVAILDAWGIDKNKFENGCVLQDGSFLFTGSGEKHIHNPLYVNVDYKGVHIEFEGEDLLYIQKSEDGYVIIHPKGTCSKETIILGK